MKPTILLDFLSRKTHSDIYKFVKHRPFVGKVDTDANITTLEKHPFLLELHQQLVKVIEPVLNAPILASKSSLHIFEGQGNLNLSSDEDGVSLYYVVYQDAKRPIAVDGIEFFLGNNHAILYDSKEKVNFSANQDNNVLWCLNFKFSFQRL